MFTLEITFNVLALFGVIMASFAFGFFASRKQLATLRKEVVELEKEMLERHANILEVEKEKAELLIQIKETILTSNKNNLKIA